MFSSFRLSVASIALTLGMVGCGGGAVSPQAPGGARFGGNAPLAAGQSVVTVPLTAAARTYALPLAGSAASTISLHAAPVDAGTTILLSAIRRATHRSGTQSSSIGPDDACATSVTVEFRNGSAKPISLDIDGFSLALPCTPARPLYGVSFYPVAPVTTTIRPIKLGDVTVNGMTITFTSRVATVVLPPNSTSAISAIPEDTEREIGIPIVPGTTQVLTANASLPTSLSMNYPNVGGGGTLYSSSCAPAIVGGVRAPAIAAAIIEGIPSFYCTLGTVDSASILFGPSVTFTLGSPIPDRSFISLDGPSSEFPCDTRTSPVCVTPPFTVPVITNVIAGNVLDLQACFPAVKNTNCNSDENASPAASATSVPAKRDIQLLVADDPTYVAPSGASCSGPSICGGFVVDTSRGACSIDNRPDENGDVPPTLPAYKDPGGPQEQPPAGYGLSTHAYFPGAGPDTEFDIVTGTSGSTCIVTIKEADGPIGRSVTLRIPIR